jgi:threonine aldolase
MREAMYRAEVGDDVFGDDPTVIRLQEMAAEMLGKQAGLFVPSGTMGNLASILAHCGRGEEAILGDKAHTVLYEAGGIAALGGVHPRQLRNLPDGSLELDDIRQAIRSDDAHFPVTRLVALENTHNRCGGTVLSPAYMQAVGDLAHERGLALHLDGARLFNAAAALGVAARELAAPADSVTFCLSKGLCAPVGSVIVGERDFIRRAHRVRKQLGGGMRQAGILAAAGIVALETMTGRLAEDHERARRLAAGLAEIPGVLLDPGSPHTNMIFFNLSAEVPLGTAQVTQQLLAHDILVVPSGSRRFRLVTHYWIDDQAVELAIASFQQALSA